MATISFPRNETPTTQTEDGQHSRSRWTTLCEGVLIPLGSIFAIFLFMLGVMLITD